MKSIIIKTFFLPFTFCVLLFTFYFSSTFAQEVTNSAVKSDEKSGIEKPNSTEAVGNQINFKNETGNAIITITDEGNKIGSITLPSGSAPSTTSNKLYNVGGILNFNGTSLGSGGASALNDLNDAIYDGTSLFVGAGSGIADDGSSNYNTAIGKNSLNKNTTGSGNLANGSYALFQNTTGSYNTANGSYALYSNIDGESNTANGNQALYRNTSGIYNTANGYQALYSNTTGDANTVNGYQALYSNTIGESNTANGFKALYSNTTGYWNTANGYEALYSTTGDNNTANGYQVLYSNTTGESNTANGKFALYSNTTGNNNTANGYQALYNNATGSQNTGIGHSAGPSVSDPNLSNTTAIGYFASTTASNQVRLGNSSVTSIGGYAGWSNISDGRYKQNIKENISGLDFILGLRPVSYNMDYNSVAEKLGENKHFESKDIKGTDGLAATLSESEVESETYMREAREKKSAIRQVGFIAQEVEQLVNKLGIDFSGVEVPENEQSMYRLRYSEFVVPLVKAVQEQQKMISNQNLLIEKLTNRIDELEKR
ncbi:MAG: tail fiber domain-containing protein [Melioribacteraceae bacterium]